MNRWQAITPDAVHVWRVPLDVGPALRDDYAALLDDRERARAASHSALVDRSRFMVGRAVLRLLLGGYLSRDPARLGFATGASGKPSFDPQCGEPSLRFNVSHSRGVALIAVARQREVGVDIERIDERIDPLLIAQTFFCDAEIRALLQLAPATRTAGFFACWTRKEALLKATGDGIVGDLKGFTVSVEPDGAAAILSAKKPTDMTRWSLQTLSVGPRFQAAVAIERLQSSEPAIVSFDYDHASRATMVWLRARSERGGDD